MKKLLLILIVSAGAVQGVLSLNSACPIRDSTTIAYSVVDGVGSGSRIWISDFLSWLAASDPSAEAVSLTAQDLRVHCDLSSFLNLRVFINPGGDAYAQLYSLGVEGTDNIKAFVHRGNSSYVGICAGTYLAAHVSLLVCFVHTSSNRGVGRTTFGRRCSREQTITTLQRTPR